MVPQAKEGGEPLPCPCQHHLQSQLPQRPDIPVRLLGSPGDAPLRQAQDQPLPAEGVPLHHLTAPLGKVRAGNGAPGQAAAQEEVLNAVLAYILQKGAGLLQIVPVQLVRQLLPLRHGQEPLRRYRAPLRMLPPGQRLAAHDPAAVRVHVELDLHAELPAAQSPPGVPLEPLLLLDGGRGPVAVQQIRLPPLKGGPGGLHAAIDRPIQLPVLRLEGTDPRRHGTGPALPQALHQGGDPQLPLLPARAQPQHGKPVVRHPGRNIRIRGEGLEHRGYVLEKGRPLPVLRTAQPLLVKAEAEHDVEHPVFVAEPLPGQAGQKRPVPQARLLVRLPGRLQPPQAAAEAQQKDNGQGGGGHLQTVLPGRGAGLDGGDELPGADLLRHLLHKASQRLLQALRGHVQQTEPVRRRRPVHLRRHRRDGLPPPVGKGLPVQARDHVHLPVPGQALPLVPPAGGVVAHLVIELHRIRVGTACYIDNSFFHVSLSWASWSDRLGREPDSGSCSWMDARAWPVCSALPSNSTSMSRSTSRSCRTLSE